MNSVQPGTVTDPALDEAQDEDWPSYMGQCGRLRVIEVHNGRSDLSDLVHKTHELRAVVWHWNDMSISLSSKIRLMRSLVTSIFLYACESWTLQRRIQAMEMRCYRKIPRISYKDQVTNEEVRAKIQQATGPHEDPLTMLK